MNLMIVTIKTSLKAKSVKPKPLNLQFKFLGTEKQQFQMCKID